jgi:hypothetical protein
MSTQPIKFKKRPVIINAIQWNVTMSAWQGIMDMGLAENRWKPGLLGSDTFYIVTLEGDMLVSQGDWVIKGVAGEFYPCKPDIFDATYEEVKL